MVNFLLILDPSIFWRTCSIDIIEPDLLGYLLTLTALLIINFRIMGSFLEKNNSKKQKLIFLLSLINFLIVCILSVNNIFYFYLIFELSVIPIYLIIAGWGYQPERTNASNALLFYTVVFSCPFLIYISYIIIYSCSGNIPIFNYTFSYLGGDSSILIITNLMLLNCFLVKIPIYGMHIWLPKAHVEAPVYGSIELAGILLKLGGVGLVRFSNLKLESYIIELISLISILRIFFISVSCIFISDLKVIIAYSSVAHMSLVIICLMTDCKLGVLSRIVIMCTHAFSSSGIFFVSFLIYQRSNSRDFTLNKGLISKDPKMASVVAILVLSNISTPPIVNFIGETFSFIITISVFPYSGFIIFLGIIFSSFYSIKIYSSSFQGKSSIESFNSSGTFNNISFFLLLCYVFIIVIINFVVYNFFY